MPRLTAESRAAPDRCRRCEPLEQGTCDVFGRLGEIARGGRFSTHRLGNDAFMGRRRIGSRRAPRQDRCMPRLTRA